MKKLGIARSVFVASAVAVALALAGCGGGGGSDDRADAADAAVQDLKDRIADLEGQVETLTGERDDALGDVADLEEMIGSMDDAADANGSLYAQLNAAMAVAAGLRDDIGEMADPADMDGSLHAQINYHMEETSRIQGLLNTANSNIGDMDDPADMGGSLYAQINYHMEEASRIQGLLNTANGDLITANGRISTLEGMIGNAGDAADTAGSLYAQLNHYKAEAARLQGLVDAATNAQIVAKAKAVNTAIRAGDGATSATNPAAPGLKTVKASPADGLSVASSTARLQRFRGGSGSGRSPERLARQDAVECGWRHAGGLH